MGMGAARLYDMGTGHDCYPPRPSAKCSPNVLINNRQALNIGSLWAKHSCGSTQQGHQDVQAHGSETVMVNGTALARIGDDIGYGGTIITGSENVLIG